jgi:predicted NBD/HSP70 family sugar kinase
VAGVPGVIEAPEGRVGLAGIIPGLEGLPVGSVLEERLEVPVSVENDVNLAAVGEHWRGVGQGVDNFVFLSIGTGLGAGLVLQGELHRGHHGAAGEVDFALGGDLERENDPAASGVVAVALALSAHGGLRTSLTAPFDARAIFRAARADDELARAVVDEEARRIAQHIVPIAAVADVALIVLGGGIGANGDLLLAPIRALLAERCPYPPRVEVSSLGDAAVLTGALAIGLRAALDNVFVNRARAAPAG